MNTKNLKNRSLTAVLTAILLMIAIPTTTALASTLGPNYAGTAATGGGSGVSWMAISSTLVDALGADGGTAAQSFLGSSDNSENLNVTNFGFSIPAGATIDGISVEMNRFANSNNGGNGVRDTVVQLYKGASLVGDNKALTTTTWPTSSTSVVTYGGATDLWGTTWTPEEINASNFGVTLDVTNTSTISNRTANVDYVRITVAYTEAATSTTTTLSALSPVSYGTQVIFTATVSPTPTDGITVEFYNGLTLLGTGTTSAGVASYTTTATQLNAVNSPHSITAKFVGSGLFLESTSTSSNQIVNPKLINVTAESKSKTYGDADPVLTYTADALVESDSFSGALTRDTGEDVGAYTITQGTLTAGDNYAINFTGANLTINTKSINVTAETKGKTYGDADPILTYAADALIGSDSFSGALTRDAGEDVGSYAITQGTLTAGGNYTINFTGANLAITVRTLTVTANDKTIYFGNPDPIFDFTTNGFVFGNDFVTQPTCAVAGEHTALGAYDIECSGGDAGANYSIIYEIGTLTISNKIILDVSVANTAITYGDTVPVFTPQYDGFTGGDDEGDLDTVPTCSATGSPFTAIGSPYAIVCSGGLDSKYDFNYINGEMTVNAKAVSVTANPGQSKSFGSADPIFTYTADALVGSDSFSGVLNRVTGEAVGFYAITQGTLTAGDNYTINFFSNDFEIVANSAPSITEGASVNVTISKNGFPNPFSLTLNASDPESNTITWSISSAASNGTATASGTGNSKAINYEPNLNFSGSDSFIVQVSDVFGGTDTITVNVTVSAGGDFPTFADVQMNGFAWAQIEAIYAAGITGGCSTNPLNYCPDSTVTRAQMAVFLLRGIHGSGYTPPAATGTVFGDVPANGFAAAWIEQLVAEGITSGCGGGNYCPNSSVTRAQMAVFLLRAKYTSTYTPPAATGTVFGDVPADGFAAAWIEQLVIEGITSGCGGNNYCPGNAVTRAQMAVFLQRTFNLPMP